MRLLLAALGLAVLCSCRPTPDVEPLPCRDPEPGEAVVGSGNLGSGFQELTDGDDLLVSFGPQGQHMVTISLQVWGMEEPLAGGFGSDLSVAMLDDGEIFGGTVVTMVPSVEEEDYVEFLGLRSIITAAEIGVMTDRPIEIVGVVVDGCGRELESSVELVLVE